MFTWAEVENSRDNGRVLGNTRARAKVSNSIVTKPYTKVIYNMTYMQELKHPRNERRQQLFELADVQGGYFTSAQARTLGYLKQYQQHHRETGAWQHVSRGLFRLREYPQTDYEQWVQLTLWSHNRQGQAQAVVSHETALRFYDLSDVQPDKVHLSVPPSFRKVPPAFAVLHKAQLAPSDVQSFTGFSVTTPLRTLLDVAQSHLSPEHLEAATAQALQRGLVRRKALRDALATTDVPQEARAIFQRVMEQV
jgi:predicted transcriptional regulator of viral defense system